MYYISNINYIIDNYEMITLYIIQYHQWYSNSYAMVCWKSLVHYCNSVLPILYIPINKVF